MHMADALVSTPVAIAADIAAVSLIAIASKVVAHEKRDGIIPLMGVLGAFVFAAQMINFSIPGTGSSGHIIGGILLGALMGPWCAFLTLCSVLIVQCLIFADGGLLAIGCNIVNMAAMSCLLAYPLIYKPIVKGGNSSGRIMWASILACVVGLECGAFLVALETVASGVTALPFGEFLMFMMPIHLIIGACEGVATGLVLVFVKNQDPALLQSHDNANNDEGFARNKRWRLLLMISAAALALGIAFVYIASSNPDGLEWSIMKIAGTPELEEGSIPATAIMPDYESKLSGIVGGIMVMTMIWALSSLLFRRKKSKMA